MFFSKRLKTIICSGTFAFLLFFVFNAFAATRAVFYTYDENNQVIQAQYTDTATVDYTFDLMGNRLTKTTSLAGSPPNNPPDIPVDPVPSVGAIDVSTSSILEWDNTDPDNGDVIIYYIIYFGDSADPPLVTISSDSSFDPGPLKPLKTYYWKIVTIDNHNEPSTSPVYSFTTTNDSPEIPQLPFPEDESLVVARSTGLGWISEDPNSNDTVTYDIYFDTSNPVACQNQIRRGK